MPAAAPSPSGRDRDRAEGYVGMALYGCVVAGLAGLGIALFAAITSQLPAAALGIAASAIAFGALANALLRH